MLQFLKGRKLQKLHKEKQSNSPIYIEDFESIIDKFPPKKNASDLKGFTFES